MKSKGLLRLLTGLLIPVGVLLVAEAALRVGGYGYPTSYFVKTTDGQAYKSNFRFAWLFFGRALTRAPIPTVLSRQKHPGAYRIFVLGGSAARGTPDEAYSFARILEAMLNEAFPATRFEVINTGMTAINSHVVLPIVRECARFDGDLYIVYLGNNEVIGPYGTATVFHRSVLPLPLIRLNISSHRLRIGQLLINATRAVTSDERRAHHEWGGLQMFTEHGVAADDPRLRRVYANFECNLRDICRQGQRAGVPVIVATVLTNLRDCPPFRSAHRPDLPPPKLERWEQLYGEATRLQASGHYEPAIARYASAAAIDDVFAELEFRMGQCCLALRQSETARAHFTRARDLDTLRFRADTRINRIIQDVAQNRETDGIYLVDAEHLPLTAGRSVPLGERSPVGTGSSEGADLTIPGYDLLYEHVHLNFSGNYGVARALFTTVCRLLPPAVRRARAGDVEAPSLAQCAHLTVFTPYDRVADVREIAISTASPPFSGAQAERYRSELRRMESELTPEDLSAMAERYQDRLARRPEDLLLRRNFAELQYYRGDYASAAAQWEALLKRYPDFGHWYYRLGHMYLLQNKAAEAIAPFRELVRRNPDSFDGLTGLGEALFRIGQVDGARTLFRKAQALRPGSPYVQFMLGRICLQKNDAPRAEMHFQQAIRIDPGLPAHHFGLAEALRQQHKTDRAQEVYRHAVELQKASAQ